MNEINKNSTLTTFLFSVFALILMLTVGIGGGAIRNGVSYVFSPTAFLASNLGLNFRQYVSLFSDIKRFRDEYKQVSVELAKLKSVYEYTDLLEREVSSLRKQLSLGDSSKSYTQADIVWTKDEVGGSQMVINKGRSESIVKGDVVSIGNLYIGTIDTVSSKSSSLRLPTSRSSRLQVIIFEGRDLEGISTNEIKEEYLPGGGIRAVAIGQGDSVRIENISIESKVEKGDTVVIVDERIGEYLILGKVNSVDRDLAASSLSADLDLLVDYVFLNKVFIRSN